MNSSSMPRLNGSLLPKFSSISAAVPARPRSRTWPMRGLQSTQPLVGGVGVDEELIARSEIVALPFTVSDIAETLARIEHRLRQEDDGEEPTRDTHASWPSAPRRSWTRRPRTTRRAHAGVPQCSQMSLEGGGSCDPDGAVDAPTPGQQRFLELLRARRKEHEELAGLF